MNVFFDNDWMAAATEYEYEIRYKPVKELCNAQYVARSRHLLRIALTELRKLRQLNEDGYQDKEGEL